MATSFNKVYTVTVKYSRDDGAAITDADMNVAIMRTQNIKNLGHVVCVSKGVNRSDIVSVTEA